MAQTNKRDFYEVLGVSKTATTDEIKKSYRKLALQYHPDRNPGKKEVEAKFREATEAYEVLSDDSKRKQYDQFGHAGSQHSYGRPGSGEDPFEQFSDIFENLFGGQGRGRGPQGRKASGPTPQRGHDLSQRISITLKESFVGCKKDIKIYHFMACGVCKGSGCKEGTKPTMCATCHGAGQIAVQQGFFSFSQPCTSCNGQGIKIASPCPGCRGQTRIQEYEKLAITIPAGIYHGAELRISGKGDCGIFGGPTGDLYLTVDIPADKIFTRRENDLVTTLALTYPQLVLGCQIEIENIDGTKETLKIPKGCPVDKEIIIEGKGFAKLRGHGRGNFVVVTTCDIPTKLSAATKESLLAFAEQLGNSSQNSSGIAGFFKKFLG
jgi:molecular chaperone DnaJ